MTDFKKIQWRCSFEKYGRDIYIHKVVRFTYDPKLYPWLWRGEKYLVVESELPKEEYRKDWFVYLDDVNWLALKDFQTEEEAKQYIQWICEPNHDPAYEMLD